MYAQEEFISVSLSKGNVEHKNNAHVRRMVLTRATVLLFSKLNKLFFGYFDPEVIFLDNENKHVSR